MRNHPFPSTLQVSPATATITPNIARPTSPPTCAPATPSAPPPRADLLLQALAEAAFDLQAVVAARAFSASEIADLAEDPIFRRRLAALISLSHSTLTLRAANGRSVCMDTLQSAIAGLKDPVENRRAATALLRATAAPLIPARSGTDPPRSAPTPPPTPSHASRRPKAGLLQTASSPQDPGVQGVPQIPGVPQVPGATARRFGAAVQREDHLPVASLSPLEPFTSLPGATARRFGAAVQCENLSPATSLVGSLSPLVPLDNSPGTPRATPPSEALRLADLAGACRPGRAPPRNLSAG